ncbi:hypothetical protein [Blastococcus litoris]|uniref:hypothetical protein n=1 Tax=Blastococcus litoris TaxID=2171622 RepID=UPI000E30B289|nr:hypothetical protein [Blastococcus litoris]
MGKHAAPEGATADPIVADALARRPAGAAHHAAVEGPVGWPGTPAEEGGGLGWPGGLGGDGTDEADSAPEEPAPPAPAAPDTARRGWRRLLGVSRVA